MLVLSRKKQQQILIPGLDIRITVLSISAGRVQLGIEAPRGIEITRPDAGRPECCLSAETHRNQELSLNGYH
jgi:carbon storage regulator CsrA